MQNSIFTMTVISGELAQKDPSKRLRSRCWGYYFSLVDADYDFRMNATDMSEHGYYRYGVLGELREGPGTVTDEIQWYEFIWEWPADGTVERTPKFVEAKLIDKPEIYQQLLFGGM